MRSIVVLLFLIFMGSTLNAQDKSNLSDVKSATLRLKPGEDLKLILDAYIKFNEIKAACILSCAGSLQVASIRFADQKETNILKEKFEIVSLSGTLSVNGSHLHISISDSNGKTMGGHLKEGSIVYTTAEIVIGIFPDLIYTREQDDTYGYKELKVNTIKE